MRTKRCACVAFALLAACVSSTPATTWYITPDGSGDAPTIRAAVDSAAFGDTLLLADGTYVGNGNRDVRISGPSIVVRSESGNPETCVIDCEDPEGNHQAFVVWNNSTIEGITIINGIATNGGAILCTSGVTIRNCVFSGNRAGWGGAIEIGSAPGAQIIDCTFIENTAVNNGGAIAVTSFVFSLTVSNCLFVGNTARFGAGMHFRRQATFAITDCTFLENEAQGEGAKGGGIHFDDGSSGIVSNCTFAWNVAQSGGGVLCQDSSLLFEQCTFVGNKALLSLGSGVRCWGMTSAIFTNTVIAFSSPGVGVHCSSVSTATLTCSNVYGNAGGDWIGCLAGQDSVGGNLSEDPLFCNPNPLHDDFTLAAGSPCLPLNNSCGVLIGAHGEGCGTATGIRPENGKAQRLIRVTNHPNPFNPRTIITYSVASPGQVKVGVYDVRGRMVTTLVREFKIPGEYTMDWDGRDSRGNQVGTGVYFVRLETGGQTASRKIVFLK
ncbi:MAG: right-handed parallel beta-helix repeat-containing protein [Candidatus Krumholzibacteria bacterium]